VKVELIMAYIGNVCHLCILSYLAAPMITFFYMPIQIAQVLM